MIDIAAAAGIAAIAGAIGLELDEYRKTNHGKNPWTPEGVINAIRISWHIDTAAELVRGKVNSVFRSPDVNRAAGGVDTSYHKLGLAADIAPAIPLDNAAQILLHAAESGKLGPIRRITKEVDRGIVHLEWCKPGEPRPVTLHIGKWP